MFAGERIGYAAYAAVVNPRRPRAATDAAAPAETVEPRGAQPRLAPRGQFAIVPAIAEPAFADDRAKLDVQKIQYVLLSADSDYQMITRSDVIAVAIAPVALCI